MSLKTEIGFEEKYREETPPEAEWPVYDLEGKAAANVLVTFRVASVGSGASNDQTGDLKVQFADPATGSSTTPGTWRDVPGGAFRQVSNANTFPYQQTKQFPALARFMRLVPAHGGTTPKATWGAEVSFLRAGQAMALPSDFVTQKDPSTGNVYTVANGSDTTIFSLDVTNVKTIWLGVRNLGGGGGAAFQNAKVTISDPSGSPAFDLDTSIATLAANADSLVKIDNVAGQLLKVVAQGNAGTTTAQVFAYIVERVGG